MARHRRHLRALVLALALLAASLASPAAGKTPSRGKDFLWKISSPGATGYLLGSVHVLESTAYRSNPAFESAFRKAQIVVFETDLDQLDSKEVQRRLLYRGSYPKGESLRQSIPEKLYSRVEKTAGELGLPPPSPQPLPPLVLRHDPGQSEAGGPRIQSGKKTLGLETPADQIDIFADMSPGTQEKFLKQSLDDLEDARRQVEKILAAWKAGDTGKVESLLLKSLRDDPGLYRRLVVQRNQRWMKTLEHLLEGHENFLVVVGAAHLVGPDGLVALLRARDFSVEQR
jgi:uncharacterized protein YbaP (TraB family)